MRQLLFTALLAAALAATASAGGKTKVVLDNTVTVPGTVLRLYVDDEQTPRCEAAVKQSCRTMVDAGEHWLTAKRASDGKTCGTYAKSDFPDGSIVMMIVNSCNE